MMHRGAELLLLLLAAAASVHAKGIVPPGHHAVAITQQGLRGGIGIRGRDGPLVALRGGGEVAICGECGLPEEYCEYNDKCQRPDRVPRARGASPNKYAEQTAEAEAREEGEAGTPDASQEDAEYHERAKKEMEEKKKHDPHEKQHKPKGTKPKGVSIKVDKRRARKFVTTLTGVEPYLAEHETLKDAAKMLASLLAAGASAVKGEGGQPDHIVMQGDRAEEVQDFCAGKLKVPTGLIKITY